MPNINYAPAAGFLTQYEGKIESVYASAQAQRKSDLGLESERWRGLVDEYTYDAYLVCGKVIGPYNEEMEKGGMVIVKKRSSELNSK